MFVNSVNQMDFDDSSRSFKQTLARDKCPLEAPCHIIASLYNKPARACTVMLASMRYKENYTPWTH